jgi:hypothetical protein
MQISCEASCVLVDLLRGYLHPDRLGCTRPKQMLLPADRLQQQVHQQTLLLHRARTTLLALRKSREACGSTAPCGTIRGAIGKGTDPPPPPSTPPLREVSI